MQPLPVKFCFQTCLTRLLFGIGCRPLGKQSPARDPDVKTATGLEAVSEDVLVQICDYVQERDMVR